jgi:F-box and leucine-rich repeat protein 2/20
VPLLRGSPHLEALSLYWNLNISDAVLTAAASSCAALRSVNVSGCKRVSDVGVAALAAACPQLTELDLTRCRGCAVPAFTYSTTYAEQDRL